MSEPLLDRVYDGLFDDDDGRVCRDIDDAACTDLPRNFFTLTAGAALTKLGDALINPKATLPWLLAAMGAPAWMASVVLPLRESGSMLPQLAIGGIVRALPMRKWAWVGGCLGQVAAVLAMLAAAAVVGGTGGGWMILGAVCLFALSRGFASIAAKDVMGKTVPKGRRGRVNGFAASLSGIFIFAFALWLVLTPGTGRPYLWLLGAGALLWLAASLLYLQIREQPGATEGGINGLEAAIDGLSLLRTDRPFRHFVVTRALVVGSSLLAPLLVLLGGAGQLSVLGYFLAAQAAASILGGPVWGRFADQDSRRLLLMGAGSTALLGMIVLMLSVSTPERLANPVVLALLYFVLALVHDGIRIGRKTYVVDLATEDTRTDYVAVSNSVMGVWLLVIGGLVALASQYSTELAVALLVALSALGAFGAARLVPVG